MWWNKKKKSEDTNQDIQVEEKWHILILMRDFPNNSTDNEFGLSFSSLQIDDIKPNTHIPVIGEGIRFTERHKLMPIDITSVGVVKNVIIDYDENEILVECKGIKVKTKELEN